VLAFSAGALRGHRLRTGLSLLGVAIGIASVVLLTSLGEGARSYVTGEFSALGSNLLIVVPGKTETTGMAPLVNVAPHDLTLADVESISRHVREVRRVAPLSFGGAPAAVGAKRRDISVAGTTAAFQGIRQVHIGIGRYLPAGELERGGPVCVIGAKLQSELFLGENPLGEILRLGDERFRVIGVMAPRGVSIGMDLDEMVHVPVDRALRLFDRSGLFRILIEVRSRDEIAAAKAAVVEVLRARHEGREDFTVLTQDSVLATFGRILALLTAALAGIAAISLTVAGIGIMNVMLVSVSERTREIGLLKALGARSRHVVAVFLVEATILSASGGVVGLGIAFAATAIFTGIYPGFPIEPPLWAVLTAAAVSISVGLLFGTLPARRAARLDPVAALTRR
jgi:putative ABC transport system permease protein